MVKLVNRAKMTTATTGTGTITLGSAATGYQSFAAAAAWEVGSGTYTAAGTTLARTTILESSNADAALILTGDAVVFVSAVAEDFVDFSDSTFRIQDDGDATKEIAFQASGITTGTVRTLTVGDASGTIALIADLTAGYQPLAAVLTATTASFLLADETKLDGIEALADVTDATNVTAAGALMDSEVDADIKTLVLPASTTISAFGASLIDDANAAAAQTTLGVDPAGTDNSTNVSLAGTPDYITLSGQVLTRNAVDLAADVTGNLPVTNLNSGTGAGATTFWRGDGTWVTPSGSGDVAKVGTPVNNQIGVWTGDGTLEGDADFTFDAATNTLAIAASGKVAFGAITILDDTTGTTTLSNIDALDATTEATIETAIDTLSNLTSVGTIATGVWAATDVAVLHGGTGSSTAAGAATNLGVGTGDSPQFTAVNVGHATDTTLARVSAGLASIEGDTIALLTATQTMSSKTLADVLLTGAIGEEVFTLPSSTTPELDPADGTVQKWTLTGASTPTEVFADGESITLMIDDGTAYAITWPTMTWVNNAGVAPTLATTGFTTVALWHFGTLYGALVGDGT